jgi:ATP-binding cassette, subfamily B, bacterial MsbA
MFQKILNSKTVNLYTRALKYVRHYWLSFVIAMLSNVIYSSLDVYFVYLLKPILDKGFIDRNLQFISFLPFLILGIFILRSTTGFSASYFMARASRGIVMLFRQNIFSHLLRLPATYYDNHSSGYILSGILYNVEQVASAGADTLTDFIQSFCMIVGYLVVMFSVSWKLSLLFLIAIPVIAVSVRWSNKRLRRINLSLQKQMGGVTSIAEEAVGGYKVIRAFGGQEYETNKFNRATEKNRSRELKIIVVKSLGVVFPQLAAALVLVLIIYLATTHKALIAISAGGFAALVAAMVALLKPLKNFTKINATIQRGLAGAENVFALLDEKGEKDAGTLNIEAVKGAVKFKDVSFTYSNTKRVILKDIDFDIKPGQVAALVGHSGGGKTTVVNLLQRFYDGYSGKIYVDDMEISKIVLADLRQQFALVSQHVVLFNDTVAHNIAYGRFSNASEDEIITAAKAANAWEFIEQMPERLNTLVGENGVLLSGGQRQRIAIARAILKNAPILVLDEATSALDTESERQIQAALEELIKNRTTLVVAHRLSTIENADIILVLEKGRIVERGSHQELLARKGYYSRLYGMQFRENQIK